MLKKLSMVVALTLALTACQTTTPNNTEHQRKHQKENTVKQEKSQQTGKQTGKQTGICREISSDKPGDGRNVLYRCNGQLLLQQPEAKAILNASIPVSFGSGGRLTTRQSANAFGKDDEEACKRAFINAIAKFQRIAEKEGKRRISGVNSNLNHKLLTNGQYDCAAGTFHARVLIRATLR